MIINVLRVVYSAYGAKAWFTQRKTEQKVDTETKLSQFYVYCSELVKVAHSINETLVFCVERKAGF